QPRTPHRNEEAEMRNTAQGRRLPLHLEKLEDRTLPSTTPNPIDLSGLRVDPNSYDPSRILVQFRSGATPPQSLLPGTTLGPSLGLVNDLYDVNLTSGVTVNQALAAYQADPNVLSAEADYSVDTQGTPNDP